MLLNFYSTFSARKNPTKNKFNNIRSRADKRIFIEPRKRQKG